MFGKSKFKPPDDMHPQGYDYVTVLVEVDGEQRQCSIGGQVVVEGLKKIEPSKDTELPAPVIFTKKANKDGKKTYWTME